MHYGSSVILDVIRRVNMWLCPAIIAKGRDFNCSVWYDNVSFTPTGEVDLFVACEDEEDMIDFFCWVQNTYGLTEAA